MKIKINDSIVCIPPFISTKIENIQLIQLQRDEEAGVDVLLLTLINGKSVSIPGLDANIIEMLFNIHAKHLEESDKLKSVANFKSIGNSMNISNILNPKNSLFGLNSTIDLNFLNALKMGLSQNSELGTDCFDLILQHNSSHKNNADIPEDIIIKITSLLKIMLGNEIKNFPAPEPHCNCMHCQLCKFINNTGKEEDRVSDEDLFFVQWEVIDHGDHLYVVTNPMNRSESYNVYIGSPIGCTCGNNDCEHIKTVLYS